MSYWMNRIFHQFSNIRLANTSALQKTDVFRLRRELFLLWMFVGQEGLWNEATDFVHEYETETALIE